MLIRRIGGALPFIAGAFAVACGSSEPTGTQANKPSEVAIVSGDGQVGLVGQTLSVPLVVKVSSASTDALSGIQVAFAVVTGSATISPTTATTDASGQAKTQVTLGASPGTVTISAKVANTSLTALFTVRAGAAGATIACESMSPASPGPGGVLPGIDGSGICLSGGSAGAEYALIAFNSDPSGTTGSSLPVDVTAHGAAAVTTASIAPNLNVAPGVGGLALQRPSDIRSAFDARLREIARRELAPKVPAAQAAMQRRASFNAIPANPTVGSFVNLNANGSDACTNIKTEVGRVAAISNNAIIVADTTNPSGGFTDAEYKDFATTFDTLINPIDVAAFGQPTDIDNNGKIVIFFTKEVNLLTPRGSPGVIGGFFFERDLFPLSDTNDFRGCPGSNLAEMFYVLVPDPNHVYGDARSKQKVLDVTPGTLAHEYQHLINAGRRMYKNLPFDDFEEVWLNEGLSHIAEELLYYHVSGFAPRQNLDPSKIAATQTSANNFNKYQGDNSGRFETFLNKPSQTSVYGNNDSLETRGATWDLLRYLADHRGSSDGDTWSQLVNTQLTGHANLAHVFGADYMTQISNWATSVFADDIPGVNDPRFLEPSWDMRAIYPRLVDDAGHPLGRYPLQVTPLSDVLPADLSIWTGGAAYLRFSVAPGSQASIDWAAGELPVSPFIQFTVVRTR